jgi:hypothetical protein
LEKVQKELRVYLSVHKDLEMMQYVNFKRDFEVEQWIERIHPEWLKVQSSSLPIVNGPILNKFPGDHTIGSLITSQNSNPTTVQSLDILEKKSTENTFEEEFIDFGPDVEDEIRKSNDLLLSMQQQNDRSVSNEPMFENLKETDAEHEKRMNEEFLTYELLLREEEAAEERNKNTSSVVKSDGNIPFWSNPKRIFNTDLKVFKQNLVVEKDEKAPRENRSLGQKRMAVDLFSPLSTPRPRHVLFRIVLRNRLFLIYAQIRRIQRNVLNLIIQFRILKKFLSFVRLRLLKVIRQY